MVDVIEGKSISNGIKTVTNAGTRVQLGTQACRTVVIKALATNTGIIYVGSSTVSSANGFQLQQGESVALSVNLLSVIYLDSSVNMEGVSYIVVA